MGQVPTEAEWNLSGFPEARRANLVGRTFEEITALIAAEADVRSAMIVLYKTPPRGNPQARLARQAVFRIAVSGNNCDLFFNAPDGLRGRYWQSPSLGYCATRYFVDALMPKLLHFVLEKGATVEVPKTINMGPEGIRASLSSQSARLWPSEFDAWGMRHMPKDEHFLVRRWLDNEARCNKGLGMNAGWRWAPNDRDLEIKGALLDPDAGEHVPVAKEDFADQIHLCGFS